jgi:hypothetical protein
MRVVVLNWAEGGARGWGRVAGVGDAERWLWEAGAMAIGGTPIGGARSGRFVRIGAVSFGELIVGVLICGVLIMVWAALAVVRLGRGEIAARGFRSGTTEWRSWQSEANAAAMAPSSACSTRINADQRRSTPMLFAQLLFESASSENPRESGGLAIPVPLRAVLARGEEWCSRAAALGACFISRAHCLRQLATSTGYAVSMWAAK